MDFGLARLLEEVRRSACIIGGTPDYMSREQTLCGDVDQRADLYASGITFFELAAGRVPFPEGEVGYHNCHTPAPGPRDLAPDLRAAPAELIPDLLHKESDDRPGSATEVFIRVQRAR